ncbi:TPA: hypothetical protein ACPJ0T_004280 [Vibrio alginolyticus]
MKDKTIKSLFVEVHQEIKRRLVSYGHEAKISYLRSGRHCHGTVLSYSMGSHPRVMVRSSSGKEYPIMWFHIIDIQPSVPSVCGTQEKQIDIFNKGVAHG